MLGFKNINLRLPILLLALMASLAASAQEWPKQKPLTLVVAFGPGSSTDIVGRIVAQKLTESLGQSVVVENKPGAGGSRPALGGR